ncbi:MAG: chorismate-binding protein, partial [Candidatus Gracilibacteria bacterium]|nr:chorismate-binding protein [Candidatus Gracilibacteria bacterium]
MREIYNKPFVVSKKKGETFIKYFSGEVRKYDLLEEISDKEEQIFVVPFSQAKERGFKIEITGMHSLQEKEKIISIICEEKKEFSFSDFEKTFEEKESILNGNLKEHFSQTEYEELVKNIIEKEIGNGEGANFLVAQKIEGKIKDFDIEVGLSIFKRLLQGDYGTYLHFIFFDGEKLFIGASPERNVSIEKISGQSQGIAPTNLVRMNPISGTFKKNGYKNYLDFKKDFIEFLQDQKEIDELFMATDEELKMMSQICSSGGMIVGPILKEMAHLIHTEYLLSGKSNLSKIDILRKSMWASTVIGSPIESAFRVVVKYEKFSRKYYAGAICHITENSLDSAIMIRTLQLDISGNLEIYVGASLVKDSSPTSEYEELKIKMKGVL